MFEARVIKDSICNGHRLTTMQVTMPRIILAEWNTHCMFARNTSSSRAIPFSTMVKRVIEFPFVPIYWGCNQGGMQSFTELTGQRREIAIQKWLVARDNAVKIATELAGGKCEFCNGMTRVVPTPIGSGASKCSVCDGDGIGLNLHKQVVNRLLEPWMWTTNCTTGDASAWSNFFALRCHPDAEPHMQKIAYMAQLAYYKSTPEVLEVGQWHTPYIKPEEYAEIYTWSIVNEVKPVDAVVSISTGRCARTSYLTQEGTRDFGKDIELHDRLRYHVPLHASPFEHVCQAMGNNERYAKYTGWKSYRHFLPREYVKDFKPNHPELN